MLEERMNFKHLIYNLTSNLSEQDLNILYDFANREEQNETIDFEEYGDLKYQKV